jgi:Arc/MetJ-type ribon-helix-helix transcriptional regulator
MGWSLAELREMESDEYRELLDWAKDKNKDRDPDSSDADAIIEAMDAKARKKDDALDDDA